MNPTRIYLDFDGVINAFPDAKVLRRGGVGHTGWLKDSDPRKSLYSEERAFRLDGNEQVRTDRGRFRIHFSRQLVDGLRGLAESGVVELHWLSTWQDYCSRLNQRLGWSPDIITTERWYDMETGAHRKTGKKATIFHALEQQAGPIIWIDDEECFETPRMQIESIQPKYPVLLIRPDERIAISRRQWRLIQEFIAKPEEYPAASLDEEKTIHAHREHIGF
ncbi:HAD domain-containing protein [Bifidobacterium callitrichidarum]|uniref:Uncharacterized protein n=1 Tax=Bifidobacterium callitrichidarum TaxID=2052941 RepID=A0A2U2N0Z3_9BIFI|nr:hypothetical protein [Bifidobacterium callitrichidarum]PWG62644.1 hypothetical protein DF196_11845 [Bifidobacterium callitrichidarum]